MSDKIKIPKFPPFQKISNKIKNLLEISSNYTNTIKKYYNEDEEKVKNLIFFDPKIYSSENKEITKSTTYGLFSTTSLSQKININNHKINIGLNSSTGIFYFKIKKKTLKKLNIQE